MQSDDKIISASAIAEKIASIAPGKRVRIMEVCGTHTMSIARAGIKGLLPKTVQLISGPGCPVCVTPAGVIDAILNLAMEKDIIITTYGDMVRVPGTCPGDNLQRRRALGADVRIVYSPIDAVKIAQENKNKEVIFLGVGFETTAPGTAAAVLSAWEAGASNFSVLSMLKTVEPALRALIAQDDFDIQGFLCPGHVATIIGEKGFEFLPREYNMPAVIAGFEAEDILAAIYRLLLQMKTGEAKIENEYKRAVAPNGNELAQEIINKCFYPGDSDWRGLGVISGSGLHFKDEYAAFDAEKKFGIRAVSGTEAKTACRCGDVITGRITPQQCPLFGRRCVPEDPVGPCMVSGEGACAAAYKYADVEDI